MILKEGVCASSQTSRTSGTAWNCSVSRLTVLSLIPTCSSVSLQSCLCTSRCLQEKQPRLATSVLDTRTTTRYVRLYCSPHASSPPLTFLPASGASHDMDGAKLTLQLSPLAMIGSRTSCLKRRSAEPSKAASTCPRGSEHSTIKARGFHDQRAHQLSLWSQPSRKSPANPGAQPTMAATCSAHAHVRAERDGYDALTPDWLRSGYCKVLGKGEQAGSSLAF